MKENQFLAWADIRQKEMWSFILTRGVLAWGLTMWVIMMYISKPFTHGFTVKAIALHSATWIIAGFTFGFFVWTLNERRYKKNLK